MAHVIGLDGQDVRPAAASPEDSGELATVGVAAQSTTISIGATTPVMGAAFQRFVDVGLPRPEIVRIAETATAAVRAHIGTASELVCTQNLVRAQIGAPIQEMLRTQNAIAQAIAPTQELIRRSIGLSSWWAAQIALFRSALGGVPSWIGAGSWWNGRDLWPTDALMTSVLRPLDVLRPQLLDLSRTLDNIAGVTRWIGQLNRDLWGDLCRVGRRIVYWAVCDARRALDRWDLTELAEFVAVWLDAEPTEARIEAVVEALLQIDISQYAPDEGRELLHDLRKKVSRLATARRREHEPLLGMRRGVGPIASMVDAE
jgi:hypothetical protein